MKEVESISNVRDAAGVTWRAKGQKADGISEWDTKRAKVLGTGSADPAGKISAPSGIAGWRYASFMAVR